MVSSYTMAQWRMVASPCQCGHLSKRMSPVLSTLSVASTGGCDSTAEQGRDMVLHTSGSELASTGRCQHYHLSVSKGSQLCRGFVALAVEQGDAVKQVQSHFFYVLVSPVSGVKRCGRIGLCSTANRPPPTTWGSSFNGFIYTIYQCFGFFLRCSASRSCILSVSTDAGNSLCYVQCPLHLCRSSDWRSATR